MLIAVGRRHCKIAPIGEQHSSRRGCSARTRLESPRVRAVSAAEDSCGGENPPVGTLYNYPPRGEVTALLAGYPAPTSLGAQMFAQGTICKMVAQCTQQGKSIDQAIDLARTELEGFMRS